MKDRLDAMMRLHVTSVDIFRVIMDTRTMKSVPSQTKDLHIMVIIFTISNQLRMCCLYDIISFILIQINFYFNFLIFLI